MLKVGESPIVLVSQSTTMARRGKAVTTGGGTDAHHPPTGLLSGAYIPNAHGQLAQLGGTLTGAVSTSNAQAQSSGSHVQER